MLGDTAYLSASLFDPCYMLQDFGAEYTIERLVGEVKSGNVSSNGNHGRVFK